MDKNRKARLLADLKAAIGGLPPRLKVIAKYVIDNPGDFGMDPIRVSAEKIGVSPNSLVRLAQKMGFEGFEPFRDPFRHALVTEREDQMGADWIAQLDDGDSLARTQARLARNEINIVSRSLRMMSQDRIETALRCMTGARHCYVTATRSSYAMAYYFHYVGRMALPGLQLIPRHMGSAVDELIGATEQDCLIAITFAPYSAETIQSLRYARSRGARLIVISDSEVVAPQIDPDVVFPITTQSHHYFGCYGGAMAVLECLLGHLVALGGEEAQQRIADYEATREDSGAYYKAGRTPRIRS
ncbi:iron dicitrate transport regulator FecR [Leisingera sp. ANG-M1]|uniref:MurR/RpiR family transcriptional regulator n=1 Tax=Leisingera sp. ANG-M1 TaxID=1577895 RepID=UPI00057DEBAD|nr:MurR/RpiR family transcriptional regulator [Leisingera sp. ANG-M1]KIC09019.1 iron dicitrate transport regulator FecR [Leisingera sp. ANG-M1]